MNQISASDRDHSVTLSEADRLTMTGLVLFGPRWKAPLARTLGVSRETVSRWISGNAVPAWAGRAAALLNASKGSVLSLCDRTGNMLMPWAAAGFECFAVDNGRPPSQTRSGLITWIDADIRHWLPPPRRYAMVFAFPPCTDLAVSGARWFRGKGLGALTDALELVESCRRICEWSAAPWMIENPVSTLASYWRKPDFTFHPHEFGGYQGGSGDDYRKLTCLWTGSGFRFPQKQPIEAFRPLYIHNLPPSDERGNLRSITPPGFARAVFEANAGRAIRTSPEFPITKD